MARGSPCSKNTRTVFHKRRLLEAAEHYKSFNRHFERLPGLSKRVELAAAFPHP